MPEGVIEQWMQRCIEQQGYLRFEDLHVDVIAHEYREREQWLDASLRSLREALRLRDARRLPFTVALGMSLVNAASPRGANFGRLDEVMKELDWSPPSLYLFREDDDDWLGGGQSQELGAEYRPVNLPDVRAFLREWYDKNDREYRRTFWLAG